ncbi:hypothetical protein GCM10010211_38050 [Streptomyces albospinus]|uniref:Uncharacterized protein n=1 Tax=Streptomyces albospinus TaxID=285515 RepID=A0ABQ2V5H3_9ACTN|nr:hypothetical protein GCM10010211_38050 [Streptomyces albospinus]
MQEFHLLNRPLAADGSRTVTAGSELHRPRSALLLLCQYTLSVPRLIVTHASEALWAASQTPARRLSQPPPMFRH